MPDNEGMVTNQDRAARAAKAIALITDEGRPYEVLTDLLHWCDQNGTDFGEELELAQRMFFAERAEEHEDATEL